MEEILFHKDMFKDIWPWQEYYSCGRDDSAIPSYNDDYAKPELYTDKNKLKMTATIVLERALVEKGDLEAKILSYQAEMKDAWKEMAKSAAAGSFNKHYRIANKADFSFDLMGDLPPEEPGTEMEDVPEKNAEFKRYIASKEYQEWLNQQEVVAVNMRDAIRYTGLVLVAQGMKKMIEEEVFVPEVIGKFFYDKYMKC